MVYPLLAESADSLNPNLDWRGSVYSCPVVVGVTAPTPPLKAGVPISSTEGDPPDIRKAQFLECFRDRCAAKAPFQFSKLVS